MPALVRHVALGLLACVALSAQAERLPDRRQVPAPVVSTQSMVTQEQVLDLLRQMESQQQELRQLRNQVEVQQHELDQLKGRERNLLGDIDRRLQALEKRDTVPQAANGAAALDVTPAEQRAYEAAFALMKQSQYERAIKAFRDFIARYPRSPLAGNAQYWAGEANYVLHDFRAALNEFTQLTERYPESPKMPEAMLKIGYVQAELGQPEKAHKVLADLVRRYPDTQAAKLAAKRLEGTPR